MGVIAAWQAFWFSSTSSQIYARLRMAFGIVGLFGLVGLTPVHVYWDVDGIAPTPGSMGIRDYLQNTGWDWYAARSLFAVLLIAFACMVLGIKTRVAVFVAFAGSVLQTRWNPLPLSAAHQVLVALLFCLMWADSGAAPVWYRRQPQTERHEQAIWPLRLMQLQIALIYLNSGLWKLLSPAWRDGSALHYVANLNTFHRIPPPVSSGLDPILTAATYVTMLWELGFAFMVLQRTTRTVALAIGTLVHLGILAFFEVGTFSLVMIASYLAFMAPAVVTAGVPAASRRSEP